MQKRRKFPLGIIAVIGIVAACTDINGSGTIPQGFLEPQKVQDSAGAARMAAAARLEFQGALVSFVDVTGLITDELQASTRGINSSQGLTFLDARRDVSDDVLTLYANLHRVRTFTHQAIVALARYDSLHSANRRGALYAMKGYAEVMLAELYCSGVPLSTFDVDGDFTYEPGRTTDAVYHHAIALFDTALALSSDSIPVETLARLGKARALLDLGDYRQASETVAQVPTAYRSSESIWTCGLELECGTPGGQANVEIELVRRATVADREGGNGLPWVSSYDPRTTSRQVTVALLKTYFPIYFPEKYSLGGISTIDVATGVEARLIEAEADLRDGGTRWLQILNALRTDGTVAGEYTRTGVPGVSPGPAGTIDTTWGPGEGYFLIPASVTADLGPQCPTGANGSPPHPICIDTVWYKGLRPLTDPGSMLVGEAAVRARIDLLFAERAHWLFLTGHRQGDLRRLVRDPGYHRPKATVYPVGAYPLLGGYGTTIDLVIPNSELANPHFKGCQGRD